MFDINDLFPYLSRNKRIEILSKHRTKYYPRIEDIPLSKKRIKDIEKACKKLELNILKLERCMSIHSKRILTTRSPYILVKELINFLVEAEMKRRTLTDIKRLKTMIRSQKKLFK